MRAVAQTQFDDAFAASRERFIQELLAWLRIPSISAQPEHAADVRRSAEYLQGAALACGFTRAELLETSGHPAVYAEMISDPSLPTVLIYGHHDVQPADPLDEWVTEPFAPVVRDGSIYARGAVDDKGQVWMHLKSLEMYRLLHDEIPFNVKLIVEGEEEIGSMHFGELLSRHADLLRADICVISDTEMHSKGQPAVCVGLRGLCKIEVEVSGPEHDLHSGAFGGAVANPAEVLSRIIAALKDPGTERVLVPGFYDDVTELSASDRAKLAEIPFDEAKFISDAANVPALVGETGYSPRERLSIRPTLEINGIWGGYSGPGSKTIVPARASAKITCRLVPNQKPADIAAKVRDAIMRIAPPTVHVKVEAEEGGASAIVVPTDNAAVREAADVLREVFGREPYFPREGGSIPPVEMFDRTLGMLSLMLGFGLPEDGYHAPNEKFDIEQFSQGVKALTLLWDRIPGALIEMKSGTVA